MTRAQLISEIASFQVRRAYGPSHPIRRNLRLTKKHAALLLEHILSSIAKGVREAGTFELRGFGVFYLSTRAPREVRLGRRAFQIPQIQSIRFREWNQSKRRSPP